MKIQVHILIFSNSKLKNSLKEILINEKLEGMISTAKERANVQIEANIQGMGLMYSDHNTVSVLLDIHFKQINI